MVYVPLLGRLSFREYAAVSVGFLFMGFETLLRLVILLLPKALIAWFRNLTRLAFHRFVLGENPAAPMSLDRAMCDRIRSAQDFGELCAIWGYTYEEHVVLTKDGYLLGLHRLPAKKGHQRARPGTATGNPVVYLHHGLLMNSEVWVCLTSEERSLPFVLVEQGFDVWLGNNRGNKYSKKSTHHSPNSTKFWNFSIDDFAWHDIPDSIEYILDITKARSLSYVGFSQGTAQAFAALSIHPPLNEKVNVFIALAPAMSPAGLSAPVVDALMKASPHSFFYSSEGEQSCPPPSCGSRSSILPSSPKSSTPRSGFLFDWRGSNIDPLQKVAAYAHLYSFASVKSVVHWFQIMRNAAFQMYDDDVDAGSPLMRRAFSGAAPGTSNAAYVPAKFPTRNIGTPIVLLWGGRDSLVDLDTMLRELPEWTRERRLESYEHVDILWGMNVRVDVIPEVLEVLKDHCEHPEKLSGMVNGVERMGSTASST